MVAIGDIGLAILVLGVVMLVASLAPSSIKGDLRNVGGTLAIIGAIIYVLLIVL
jgi:hypothetical protein